MSNSNDLTNKEGIDKLKNLAADIMVCLFCTDLKTDDGATCRPMTAIKVCDQGNIWFFSEKNSDKNKAIAADKNVQLFFSHPAKSSYMVVNGEAVIISDKVKIANAMNDPTNESLLPLHLHYLSWLTWQ